MTDMTQAKRIEGLEAAKRHRAADMLVKVDDEFTDLLDRYSWGLDSDGYPKAKVRGRHVRLHKLVMGQAPSGCVTDHINGNKLDNRRANLRFATFRENALNTHRRGDGVWFNRSKNRWQAQHRYYGHRHHIGTFRTQQEALDAYSCFVESAAFQQIRDGVLAALAEGSAE